LADSLVIEMVSLSVSCRSVSRYYTKCQMPDCTHGVSRRRMPDRTVSVSHEAQVTGVDRIHDSHTETCKGDRLVVKQIHSPSKTLQYKGNCSLEMRLVAPQCCTPTPPALQPFNNLIVSDVSRHELVVSTSNSYIQVDQKVSVHLMIIVQKITSNVRSVPRSFQTFTDSRTVFSRPHSV
jgi:hypothetical protein